MASSPAPAVAMATAVYVMSTPPRGGGGGASLPVCLTSPPAFLQGTSPGGDVVPATPDEVKQADEEGGVHAADTRDGAHGMMRPLHDPDAPGALVLCSAVEADSLNDSGGGVAVVVDPFIARKLRPHQREGVRWMYRVLHGLDNRGADRSQSQSHAPHNTGCLLADDMGLGKSLQSLALVWTMLRQGPRGVPTATRALLVCPASLVGSWGAECAKWLGGVRAQAALAEGGGAEAVDAYKRWARGAPPGTKSAFDRWPLLVTSYETLRRLAPIAAGAKPELLICDEAHRLRNAQQGSQTLAALRMVDVPRRVLLTGTPMQNNLDEYAAVMDFACPGLLGPIGDFHRRFTAPVQRGGEPDATPAEAAAARGVARELAALTAGRVLRREASINAAHLPAKTEVVVFCRLTETQRALYEEGASVVQGWAATAGAAAGGGGTAAALCAIGLMRQLANAVDQVVKTTSSTAAKKGEKKKKKTKCGGNEEGDMDEERPTKRARAVVDHATCGVDADATGGLSDGDEDDDDDGGGGRSGGGSNKHTDDLRARLSALVPAGYHGGVEGSGKLATLRALISRLAASCPSSSSMGEGGGGGERMVVVSGFSAALDLAGGLCAELGLATDRLDGRVPPDARSGLVRNFNAGRGGRVMLLSCVAGGAGLNLVGASRLVLFDTSWNPAHDHQAMARVWRDGQTRPVTIYRLLAAGTVEEKVFQRQLLKHAEAVAAGVGGEGMGGSGGGVGVGPTKFSRDELGELVAFSAAARPATLRAAGWEDSRGDVEDPLLRAAIDAEDSTVIAVVQLMGDGGRARAVAAAEREAAAAKRKPGSKAGAKPGGGPKRLAFADLLSKARAAS